MAAPLERPGARTQRRRSSDWVGRDAYRRCVAAQAPALFAASSSPDGHQRGDRRPLKDTQCAADMSRIVDHRVRFLAQTSLPVARMTLTCAGTSSPVKTSGGSASVVPALGTTPLLGGIDTAPPPGLLRPSLYPREPQHGGADPQCAGATTPATPEGSLAVALCRPHTCASACTPLLAAPGWGPRPGPARPCRNGRRRCRKPARHDRPARPRWSISRHSQRRRCGDPKSAG